jgi:hypothetical protein
VAAGPPLPAGLHRTSSGEHGWIRARGVADEVSVGRVEYSNSNKDEEPDAGEDRRRVVVVGLLADPDLPTSIARQLAEDLPGVLAERVDHGVTWEVEYARDPFEAHSGWERLIDKAHDRVRKSNWDLAVAITDVPVRSKGAVVVADVSAKHRVALVSLPALGGLRLRRRARRVVAPIAEWLAAGITGEDVTPPGERLRTRGGGLLRRGQLARPVEPGDDDIAVEVVAGDGAGASLRLLAGMVRANRPWHLVLGLSSVLAGALAGAVFGVLYSAVWQLGAALSPVRMAAVVVGAVAAFAAWLIVRHELWERTSKDRPAATGVGMRNASTVLTIGFGSLVFFVALFVLGLVGAAVVIPPNYLAGVLGQPVDWVDYLTVAVMASVLRTVAGAVGSGLEDDETVRRATYGYREKERWREVRQNGEG